MAEINAVCSICGTRVHLTQIVGDTECPICFQTIDAAECRAAFNEMVPTKGETEPSDDELIADLSKSLPDKEASPQNNDLSARQQGKDEKKKSRRAAKKPKPQLSPYELAEQKRERKGNVLRTLLCNAILFAWLALDSVFVLFGMQGGRAQIIRDYIRREFGFANFLGGDNGEGEFALTAAVIIAILVALMLLYAMKDTDAGWIGAIIVGVIAFFILRFIIAVLGEAAAIIMTPYTLFVLGALCILFTVLASRRLTKHKNALRISHIIFTVTVTFALFVIATRMQMGVMLSDYIAEVKQYIMPFFR